VGYLHIDNLYKNPGLFECFALEKIHGTSAHVAFKGGQVHYFAGGVSHPRFVALFDHAALEAAFASKFTPEQEVIVYGEAFGGSMQGMSATYGKELRFLAFDVRIDNVWLDVPSAHACATELGFRFVPYERGPMTLEWVDSQRDADSAVAVEPGKLREGVVIHPIFEMFFKDGSRVLYKHKRDEFKETATKREVTPEQALVLTEASAIADEWVTRMRLEHVLQRVPYTGDKDIGAIIRAMQEDVQREAGTEIVWSKTVGTAVGKRTAVLLRDVAPVTAG
jgi:hypothetical protein